MTFNCTVIINKPISAVVPLFSNPKYLKDYQDGFIKKVLISGEAGQVGAISKMYYKQGKGEMELTETILENKLPDYFLGSYHHKHMDNTMKSTFEALSDTQTKYSAEIDYTAFRGFIPKLMRFFPSIFKKQVEKWLVNFKAFAEKY